MRGILTILPAVLLVVTAAIIAVPLYQSGPQGSDDAMAERAYFDNGTYVIELDSNPTTGYAWAVKLSDGLNLEKEYIPSERERMVCGAGGTEVFRVTSDAPGEYRLILSYERSFEKDSSVRTETYDILFG